MKSFLIYLKEEWGPIVFAMLMGLAVLTTILAVAMGSVQAQERVKKKPAPTMRLKKLSQIGEQIDLDVAEAIIRGEEVSIEKKEQTLGYTVRLSANARSANTPDVVMGVRKPSYIPEILDEGALINMWPQEFARPQLVYYSNGEFPAGSVITTTWEIDSRNKRDTLERFQIQETVSGFGVLLWDGLVPGVYNDGGRFCVYVTTPSSRSRQCQDILPWTSNTRITNTRREGTNLIISGIFSETEKIRVSINYIVVDSAAIDYITPDTISINLLSASFFTYWGYNTIGVNSGGVAASLVQYLE